MVYEIAQKLMELLFLSLPFPGEVWRGLNRIKI